MIKLILIFRLIDGGTVSLEIPAVFDTLKECVSASQRWFDVKARGARISVAACERMQ